MIHLGGIDNYIDESDDLSYNLTLPGEEMSKVYRHKDGSYNSFPEVTGINSYSYDPVTKMGSGSGTITMQTKSPEEKFIETMESELDKQEGGKKDAIGDLNKPRLSLIPKEALWALGGALTYGENHYGSHNWRAGLKISYLLDAALRHIHEFNNGENIDQKSQNSHLGNAMANLAMAISTLVNKPEMDDRYKCIK